MRSWWTSDVEATSYIFTSLIRVSCSGKADRFASDVEAMIPTGKKPVCLELCFMSRMAIFDEGTDREEKDSSVEGS